MAAGRLAAADLVAGERLMVPTWFVWIGGASLVVLGLLQIRARPRAPGDGFYKRFVNAGTLWSLLCIAVGGALIAYALGLVRLPGVPTAPPPRPRVIFRTDR